MAGGANDDLYIVDITGDVITEAAGEGTVSVQSSVTYTLAVNIENLALTGAGNINGTGNASANTITGTTGNNSLSGGDGNDTMDGGTGTDTLAGGNNDDSLTGGIGADSLDGGAGNDTMVGGADNDTYAVDAAGDVVTEAAGGGTDTVMSAITYTLGSEVENLTLTGAGNVNATGNTLANIITGNSGNNIIIGGAGNDTIDGGTGNDTITGGAGADSINVNNGNDRLLYTSTLDVGDIVTNFDNAGGVGAQDFIDLDGLFDSLGIAAAARVGRTALVDTGADVELRIDQNGDAVFETLVLTFQGTGAVTGISIGTAATDDIQVGT